MTFVLQQTLQRLKKNETKAHFGTTLICRFDTMLIRSHAVSFCEFYYPPLITTPGYAMVCDRFSTQSRSVTEMSDGLLRADTHIMSVCPAWTSVSHWSLCWSSGLWWQWHPAASSSVETPGWLWCCCWGLRRDNCVPVRPVCSLWMTNEESSAFEHAVQLLQH